MKICILDGTTTNPGDLNWDAFHALGDTSIYDKTAENEILKRASGAEAVITNKTILTGKTIEVLHTFGTRYIGTLSTGYNVVDLPTCKALGIPVCNVPTYCTDSVAQYTMAMMLHFANQIALHNISVHQGDWVHSRHFCYWKTDFIELHGKTLGIIGYGNIGRAVSKLAVAMGMRVLYHSRSPKNAEPGCTYASLEDVLSQSDFLSLHCPLTPQTEKLINPSTLAYMKKTAIVLNAARGGLVDEAALAVALNNGHIAGAGVDVLSTEPPTADNPLLKAKNCVITPHIAWASKDARARLIAIAAENLQCFLKGQVQNDVT